MVRWIINVLWGYVKKEKKKISIAIYDISETGQYIHSYK
jgi:hypothetical protein